MSLLPKKMTEGIWCLNPDGRARSYMALGETSGLVIDTGAGDDDIMESARSVTDLPLTLVNTHYHGDHTGRNNEFSEVYCGEGDLPEIKKTNANVIPVKEGHIFDLGGRKLEVFECPGHTPGSICLLDEKSGALFSGDIIADVPVFMISDDSSFESYVRTIDKIMSLTDKFDLVMNCHGSYPISIEYAPKLKKLALGVIAGEVVGEVEEMQFSRPMAAKVCRGEGVAFLVKA